MFLPTYATAMVLNGNGRCGADCTSACAFGVLMISNIIEQPKCHHLRKQKASVLRVQQIYLFYNTTIIPLNRVVVDQASDAVRDLALAALELPAGAAAVTSKLVPLLEWGRLSCDSPDDQVMSRMHFY